MAMEESLRRLKNKVKNELIIYFCLKSHHCFGLKTEKLESRINTMIFKYRLHFHVKLVYSSGNFYR